MEERCQARPSRRALAGQSVRTSSSLPARTASTTCRPNLVSVFERASGCRVWDSENREYLDYTMAWGSALVGHAHLQVAEAVARSARAASNYAALSTPLVELAERVVSLNPWLERLRFVTSGSEATLTCVRIARGATGRPKLLKFDGAFHGSHVEGVANFGWSDAANLPYAESAGTAGRVRSATCWLHPTTISRRPKRSSRNMRPSSPRSSSTRRSEPLSPTPSSSMGSERSPSVTASC